MMEEHISAAEERRSHLKALLAREQQGSTMEQRIDIEMRLMLALYDGLSQRHAQLFEEIRTSGLSNESSSESARALRNFLMGEQTLRTKLEFAGELLDLDRLEIAACLSTIVLHYVEHGEGSFEHAYPLLQGYFLGENTLPFPQLGFLTKEEVFHLLDMEAEGREDA